MLIIGTSLGPYTILDRLGAGGMGEVWLAEDTRLGRKVAIKVLPVKFAADAERLARFEQEARAAAALNHPHIAAVFDVGQELVEAGGGDDGGSDSGDFGPARSAAVVHYMVQEHLEGETLADRINTKGAMPIRKALGLGIEIAEALSAAHGAGIVHRDLKPANIFVSPDDHAKVLDFGLAKLTEVAAANADSDSRSPTMLGTVAGQVMGTAGYMAPEQVEGEKIDQRADIFAFGCVLYEMATGRRAFAGKNVLDTLHRIANSEPTPLAEVSDQLPVDLQRILRKCLAKEPTARYQTASDLAVDVRSLVSEVELGTALPLSAASAAMPQVAAGAAARPGGAATPRGRWIAIAIAAAVAGAALGAVGLWVSLPATPARVARFDITLPPGFALTRGIDVAPDGRDVLFAGTDPDGRAGIFRRALDDLTPQLVNGTANGELPRYSPDGDWIVFNENNRLLKIPSAGGEPLELARVGGPIYSNWDGNEFILYENGGVIYRVSSSGGPAETIIDAGGEPRYDHPFALPGGTHILVGAREDGSWGVGVVDYDTRSMHKLIDDASGPRYLPTGHLAFTRQGALWAQALDLATLQVEGTPFPLRSGVWVTSDHPNLAVSAGGVMAYVPGAGATDSESLVWLDAEGDFSAASSPAPGNIFTPRLSPDEQSVAMEVASEGASIHTYDFRRDTFSLLRGPQETAGARPVWTPDGEWIYYAAQVDGDYDIFRARADRSSDPEPFLQQPEIQLPLQISPDGAYLLYEHRRPGATSDIYYVALDGGEPTTLRATEADERAGSFSPDGNWIAYRSNASGRGEVYATPFPGPGRTIQLSNDGGDMPQWAKDGSRVFYAQSPGVLLEALVVPGSDLDFEAPRRVVDNGIPGPGRGTSFDTAHDGRLIMSNSEGDFSRVDRAVVSVVLDWFEVVRQRAPRR